MTDVASPHALHGIDPIGTAGHYDGFCLLELPLPWRKDIFDNEALAGVAAAVERAETERDERWRVLGLVPGTGVAAPAGQARLIRYRKPTGRVGPYARTEVLLDLADTMEAVVRTVDGDEPGEMTPGVEGQRDVLICSHGRRDRRCGSMGLALYEQVARRWEDVRVWRVSHIGGHRFAPTGFTFPEAWCWANLDAETLDSIVTRSGDPAVLARHLRGVSGLAPAAQVLDREGFLDQGWKWVDRKRSAAVEELGDDRAKVTLTVGKSERIATVGVGRWVPTVACDSACDDPDAMTPELAILD